MDLKDRWKYLETEIRVIAENDTHIALAIRLEKALISRNLSFLAALSDLVPAPIQNPAREKL